MAVPGACCEQRRNGTIWSHAEHVGPYVVWHRAADTAAAAPAPAGLRWIRARHWTALIGIEPGGLPDQAAGAVHADGREAVGIEMASHGNKAGRGRCRRKRIGGARSPTGRYRVVRIASDVGTSNAHPKTAALSRLPTMDQSPGRLRRRDRDAFSAGSTMQAAFRHQISPVFDTMEVIACARMMPDWP